jgi:hypothetical protein
VYAVVCRARLVSLKFVEASVVGEVAGMDEDVPVGRLGWCVCVSAIQTSLIGGEDLSDEDLRDENVGGWWV